MKNINPYRSIVVLPAIVFAFACCRPSMVQNDPNRVGFEIDSLYKMLYLPVKVNDTVTVRVAFDTGCYWGTFTMDSTFCALNELHLWRHEPTGIAPPSGSGWVDERSDGLTYIYDDDFTIGVGEKNIDFHGLNVWNQRDYFSVSNHHGLFTIPKTDTTHIWELNFEHNYMEVHDSDTFEMPEDCLIAPMSLDHPQMRVTIPMEITTSDGDVLSLHREFLVDTGMGWDVGIFFPAEELPFFDGKEFVPFGYGNGGYTSRYITDAEIFDGFHIDSLYVYTLKDQPQLPTSYWIGVNFLKRFNIFFDVKNSRMGLQPLKEFHRAFSPIWRRFSIDLDKTNKGSYIVKELPDHDLNHYKAAGIEVGDEIVAINGVILTPDTTREEEAGLVNQYTVVFDVVRNGENISITMERDPNEIHGD